MASSDLSLVKAFDELVTATDILTSGTEEGMEFRFFFFLI